MAMLSLQLQINALFLSSGNDGGFVGQVGGLHVLGVLIGMLLHGSHP